jgi:alkanesulfonate monooxygenase SsuD/methylene tetrahydromethanopterin reductase-like flavin-dependent oxidoreductase (luciferase family)
VTRPAHIPIGINTSPQEVDWPTLDAAWARIGRYDVFESVWMNDHLTNPRLERHGSSWESLTAMAALAHHVPGKWLGHGVLSNTFRHPAVLAKQATLLDHATGGRFILGLGAGWHEGEHRPFGIPMPPMPERFDRFESAVHVLRALFSADAAGPPGVSRADPFYPLDGATNEPPPLTPGGPQLWLGGQRRRGIALAARFATGWMLPAVIPGQTVDLDYFRGRRERILAALVAEGRDPTDFSFAVKIVTGATAADRQAAVDSALTHIEAGVSHVILSLAPRLGASGVDAVAEDVAAPVRAALG